MAGRTCLLAPKEYLADKIPRAFPRFLPVPCSLDPGLLTLNHDLSRGRDILYWSGRFCVPWALWALAPPRDRTLPSRNVCIGERICD
jgi:hypothetical protein